MTDLAVQLEGVTKRYLRYARPVDRLKAMMFKAGGSAAHFTALEGVSLAVPRGHTVGIVGRNGSGKSTLLQIIAGTLAATEGTVAVQGRVSALLELGSGFSPEFTGRENVYFQGQILGCDKGYIDQRFEEIAAFADIGEFIEEPVKTYSSGMMVRLAFAVAIAVEPDVLIVDEALAVGDEAFQRKCFARIRGIQEAGGTILFVSHSGSHIVELCDKAVLLDAGQKLLEGPPKDVVSKYHKLLFAQGEHYTRVRDEILGVRPESSDVADAQGNGAVSAAVAVAGDHYDAALVPQSTVVYPSYGATIRDPHLERANGTRANVLLRGGEYVYSYEVEFSQAASRVRFGMLIKTLSGFELGGAMSHPFHSTIDTVAAGERLRVAFKFRCLLAPGVYFLNAGALAMGGDGKAQMETYLHRIIDAAMFRVQPETDATMTATVDFCIEPSVGSVYKPQV